MICHFISFSQTSVPGSFSKRSLESLHPFPSPSLTPASVACSFLEFPVQEPPEGSSCVRGARPCPVRSLHSNRRRCSTYKIAARRPLLRTFRWLSFAVRVEGRRHSTASAPACATCAISHVHPLPPSLAPPARLPPLELARPRAASGPSCPPLLLSD